MSLQKLASEIAKQEGKKSQARIGDIREILKVLTTILGKEMGVDATAVLNVQVAVGSNIDIFLRQVIKIAEKEKLKKQKELMKKVGSNV